MVARNYNINECKDAVPLAFILPDYDGAADQKIEEASFSNGKNFKEVYLNKT